MEICKGIHQIKINFSVTEDIKRYVYIYLVEGKNCYLIDSGVAGSENVIFEYMQKIGRTKEDIQGIFLTHSHPDHIGSASRIKQLTGCRVYASEGEREWIENIDIQYEARPIPNFYILAGASVNVDQIVKDGDMLNLEPNLLLEVVSSKGHSMDDVAYFIRKKESLFTGDSIPAEQDIPMYIDCHQSIHSLRHLQQISPVRYYCPAWDRIYTGPEGVKIIENGIQRIERIHREIKKLLKEDPQMDDKVLIKRAGANLKMDAYVNNPLLKRTILCHKPVSS